MPNRRRLWSRSEDSKLMQLVEDHGPVKWFKISQAIGSRTEKQCRDRYHKGLKPSLSAITPEKGAHIQDLTGKIGKQLMRSEFSDSSDNAIKDWRNWQDHKRKHDRQFYHCHNKRDSLDSEHHHDPGRFEDTSVFWQDCEKSTTTTRYSATKKQAVDKETGMSRVIETKRHRAQISTKLEGRKSTISISTHAERPLRVTWAEPQKDLAGREVLVGHWKDSPVPDPEKKHAVNAFIDVRGSLHTRIDTVTKGGDIIPNNFPRPFHSGVTVTFDRISFCAHLVGLDRLQVKEYVRQRAGAVEDSVQDRIAAEKKAVEQAVVRGRMLLQFRNPSRYPSGLPQIAGGDDLAIALDDGAPGTDTAEHGSCIFAPAAPAYNNDNYSQAVPTYYSTNYTRAASTCNNGYNAQGDLAYGNSKGKTFTANCAQTCRAFDAAAVAAPDEYLSRGYEPYHLPQLNLHGNAYASQTANSPLTHHGGRSSLTTAPNGPPQDYESAALQAKFRKRA